MPDRPTSADPLHIENRPIAEQAAWLERIVAAGSRETSDDNALFVHATRALAALRAYREALQETAAAAKFVGTG